MGVKYNETLYFIVRFTLFCDEELVMNLWE